METEVKPGSAAEPGQTGDAVPGAGANAPVDASAINAENITNIYRAKCLGAMGALPKVLPSVWEYCQKHRAAGRMWQDFYPLKLLELWDILQTEKPSTILELGSGCTTAVFAEYCNRQYNEETTWFPRGCNFWTVDENAKFQTEVLRDINSLFVRSAVLPTEELRIANSPENDCVFYKGLSGLSFWGSGGGFLYVDGPANSEVPCADASHLMQQDKKPAVVVFDIRRSAVDFARREFGGGNHYDWSISCFQEKDVPWYLSAVRHHTVARRRA